jgi:hypothetical protein
MYNHNVTPLAMGVGGTGASFFYSMSWFWVVLATFALVACCSAIRRVLPKVMIVTNKDLDPVTAPIKIKRHARL